MQASLPGQEARGTWAGRSQHGWGLCAPGVQAGISPRMRLLPPRSTESSVPICSFLFGASRVRRGANLAAESNALGHNLCWGEPEHPLGVSGVRVGMPGLAPAWEPRVFGCLCHGSTIPSGGHPWGTATTKYPEAGQSCWGPASPSDGLIWGDAGLRVPTGFLLASRDQQRETKARLEPEHHD